MIYFENQRCYGFRMILGCFKWNMGLPMKIFVWRFLPLSALKDAELLAPQTLSKPKGRESSGLGCREVFSERQMTQWRTTNFASSFKLTLVTLVPFNSSVHVLFFCCRFDEQNTHLRTPRSPWVLPEKQTSGPLPEHETQLLGRLLQGA